MRAYFDGWILRIRALQESNSVYMDVDATSCGEKKAASEMHNVASVAYLDGVGGQGAHAKVVLEVEEQILILEPDHAGVFRLDGPGQSGQDRKPLGGDFGRTEKVHSPVLRQGRAEDDSQDLDVHDSAESPLDGHAHAFGVLICVGDAQT